MNIFAYGMLLYPEVMFTHCKNKYESTKDTLKGYVRRGIKEKYFPGITPCAQGQVEGTIYFDVKLEDVQTLDKFERVHEGVYIKTNVTVLTEKGDKQAFAYVYSKPDNLLPHDWDI